MFEKANPVPAHLRSYAGGLLSEDSQRAHRASPALQNDRFEGRAARRAGDALRAVEWSEITARLNAARDLRLLLRNESQAPIESVAASFGDAAASYFALLEDEEPGVNPDALDQHKALAVTVGNDEANLPDCAHNNERGAAKGDAREMQ